MLDSISSTFSNVLMTLRQTAMLTKQVSAQNICLVDDQFVAYTKSMMKVCYFNIFANKERNSKHSK